MQKFFFSTSLVLLCSLVTTAQVSDQAAERRAAQMAQLTHRAPDQLNYKGYVITIQNAPGGFYGYDIFREGNIVLSQRKNPFTNSPVGLRRKKDVFELAKWQINQVKSALQPGSFSLSLPKNLSAQLQIQVN
jgi:hypothetical protein